MYLGHLGWHCPFDVQIFIIQGTWQVEFVILSLGYVYHKECLLLVVIILYYFTVLYC